MAIRSHTISKKAQVRHRKPIVPDPAVPSERVKIQNGFSNSYLQDNPALEAASLRIYEDNNKLGLEKRQTLLDITWNVSDHCTWRMWESNSDNREGYKGGSL